MRHILLSTIAAITLFHGLTCTIPTSHAAPSAAAPRGGRQVLVDGSHETREGKVVAKIYQTARGKIRGQMTFTDRASRTRVVFTIRDQEVVAHGFIGDERVRETHALSDFFELDLSGDEPVVRPAKIKISCPGWVGAVICFVASQIASACIKDGEVLGVKCGDAGGDGGTTGAQDDGEGTSTTG